MTNESPRERFQRNSVWLKTHQTMIQGDAFQRAIDFALLEISANLAKQDSDAAASKHKLSGAHQFVATLRSLGEIPTKPVYKDKDNLQPTK